LEKFYNHLDSLGVTAIYFSPLFESLTQLSAFVQDLIQEWGPWLSFSETSVWFMSSPD